jgi:hypothetical protein
MIPVIFYKIATEWLIALIICSTVSGTFMPIIRSSRIYVCYYGLWCAMPWLLVVGGQVQDSRLCVRNKGIFSWSKLPNSGPIACYPLPDLRPDALKHVERL